MNQPPSPNSDPQLPTPEPSIRQQAENSTMGGGMQAAQGDNNIQIQGDNNQIVNIINALSGQPSVAPVGDPARPKNQRVLLAEVKYEVTARLKSSLHNNHAVLINLGMQVQPEQVKRSWDAEIKIASKPSELLPPQTSIKQVFDRTDIASKLLILGEPGAGKTTMMLDLAQELVQKAEAQATYPVPVLLNLSSWKNPRQSMKNWLVEELKSKYGVRKDIGKSWLEDQQLLPLLDGLDEVKPEHQASCVQALNRWLLSEFRPQFLVVCSRREEYEKVVRGRWQEAETLEEEVDDSQEETRLNLNGAILLNALADEQIQQYLASVKLEELWQVIQHDKTLLKLMRMPLFLSILVFISLHDEKFDCQEWQGLTSTQDRLQYLFDAYWEAAMKRELVSGELLLKGIKRLACGKRKLPSVKQTRRWLVYLAQQLQRESQTEFLIEKMQPSWLLTNNQKRIYSLGSNLLLGAILYIFYWVVNGLKFNFYGVFMSGWAMFMGVASKTRGISDKGLKTVEELSFSWKILKERVKEYGLILPLFEPAFGLFLVFLLAIVFFKIIWGNLFDDVSIKLLIFLSPILLICVLSLGLVNSEIEGKILPNQGIIKSFKNSTIACLAFTLFLVSFYSLIHELGFGLSSMANYALPLALASGLILGIKIGANICIQHFTLRLTLYYNSYIPWNYARFLDYATERMFLQRVGGRYRFIHKLLQDYFAQMPLDKLK